MDKVGLDLMKLCTCGPGDAPCHGDGGPWLPLQGGHHLGVREPTASQWHLGSEGAPYVVYGVYYLDVVHLSGSCLVGTILEWRVLRLVGTPSWSAQTNGQHPA